MRRSSSMLAAALTAALMIPAAAQAQIRPGKKMPALDAAEVFNNEYDLKFDDLRGYVVVVEFWATWCGPCKISIPHLNKLHEEYKDRGVVMIGLSDEAPGKVASFMKGTSMDYLVAAGSKSRTKYNVNGIPHAFIVDPDGVIRWSGHPMAGLDEELEKAVETYKPVRRLGGGPEWTNKLLSRIEEALAKRDIDAARADLAGIDTSSLGEADLKARYDRAMKTITEYAREDFQRAEAHIAAERYEKGITILKVLAKEFADQPIGREASERLTVLENDPRVTAARRNSRTGRLAEMALDRAKRALRNDEKIRAYGRLQAIVERYAGTPAAEEAQGLLKELAKDEAILEQVETEPDSDG